MSRVAVAAFFLLVFASLANAQVPTAGNVFFGYSFYSTNITSGNRTNTNGWEGSIEGKFLSWVGIVGDFDAHYGSQSFPTFCADVICTFSADFTERNYLFGPRVSVSVAKIRPFAEFLIGAGHINVKGVNSDTSFATAIGGGLDYKLIPLVAWRFQGDYVHTRFFDTAQNNVRLSTGIVVRF
jgi:Outer membrane protein beta-barrel domain